ncbi:uncharacterized protein BHQ10_008636 [Talaromyces amestolkiae]|uniref:Uncharacterized protein n=1 Tax=Talaromyces amestolkiae TaxID=1196081 RepID=A0A364L9Y7_TALAM|nr:uncharacterized protein BHQ10_008636 [Talaromyces amestolkiae]RAO72624.1 hypothetical protein BHQ10_008636 [Talaromyces amestolkiae]
MDARPSHTFTYLSQGPSQKDFFQQEFDISHQHLSQNSQTSTGPPSTTEHRVSGQSAITLTEHSEPPHQAAFSHHTQALSTVPDGPTRGAHDLRLVGSWADPNPDTLLIENDPILSPIRRAGAAVDYTKNETGTTDHDGRENPEEAVGILRTSLHREQSNST